MARLWLTLASFLAYFVMASLLAPIGLQLAPLAREFGLELSTVSTVFGWLTGGVLLGALLAVLLYERLPLRPLVAITYALLGGVLVLLPNLASDSALRWGLGGAGALSGIGLAGAALVIARSYRADHRTSMLVVTDASFSSAGYIIAPLAGWMLAGGGAARDIYLVVAGLALVIALLVTLTPLGPAAAQTAVPTTRGTRAATAPVFWLCALALLGYTLGQQSLLIWLPTLLTTAGSTDSAGAGVLIGRYWTGMFVAQLLVAVWLLRSGTVLILWLAAWGTLLGAAPLVLGLPAGFLGAAMLIWGFANFALLKVVLGFVSDQPGLDLNRVLPRLLFAATAGTALAPILSGWVAAEFHPEATLWLGVGSLGITATALSGAALGRVQRVKLGA